MRILFLLLSILVIMHAADGQITLRDDLGRNLHLERPAQKIVSLAPSITETVCAVGAIAQLSGITDYCNYPSEVRSKQSVGGVVNPNIEVIVSLEPDLVLVTPEGNVKDSFSLLEQLGIPVFVTNPRTLEGIRKSVSDIGILTGNEVTAESLVTAMETEEASLRRMNEPTRRLMVVVALHPLIVAGTGTFLSEMINLAGGDNIAGGSSLSYPSFSREEVVEADPEVIILSSGLPGDLRGLFPEWKSVTALAQQAVCTIDADLLSRPGPRVLEGVRAMRRCIGGSQ
ncbi:MAG: helical backbone metal receptor [Ignavibacteria bacterium]|nr:helical backbone metal receptor [Ignavibacteria bacterium]